MSIHHLLEDFAPVLEAQNETPAEAQSRDMLETFEQGYKAGWEDAIRAKTDELTSVSADLARNLQDMSFTFHEARAAMLADIAPILEQIVTKAIPPLAHEALGLQIVEQLTELANEQDPADVEIRVSPNDEPAVQALLPESLTFPVTVIADSHVAKGQCQIRFGVLERQIDVEDVVQNLSQALAGFVHQSQREVVNG